MVFHNCAYFQQAKTPAALAVNVSGCTRYIYLYYLLSIQHPCCPMASQSPLGGGDEGTCGICFEFSHA